MSVSFQRWTRLARHTVALAVLAVGSAAAWAQTNAVGTLAGTVGTSGYLNATGTSAQFRFTNPAGVVADSSGNVYVADPLNNAIRRIAAADSAVTTFAGSTSGVSGTADGNGTAARFTSPQGLAIDGANNIYVADTGNHAIRRIAPNGDVTTLAGTAGPSFPAAGVSGYTNNATGTSARFNQPLGIAADRATGGTGAAINVFVADTQNNVIRQVVVATGAVTTLAGSPTSNASGNDNGAAANARFSHPDSLVSNSAGTTIYVADTFNHLIRQITIAPGPTVTVGTLAGSGSASYGEAMGTSASFNNPTGITLDTITGNVLVADTANHVIRSITPAGQTALFAGGPQQPSPTNDATNGLALTVARFRFPSGIGFFAAAGPTPNVFVVDTAAAIVRRISPAQAPSINTGPAAQIVNAGANAVFSVTANGSPGVSYQWQRSTDNGGSWQDVTNGNTLSGASNVAGATGSQLTLTAVTTALNSNQFRVVVSNGVAPNATSIAALLTVNQIPEITNVIRTFNFTVGQSSSFTVTATGSPAPEFASGGIPVWASLNQQTGVISGTPFDATTPTYIFAVTATNTVGTSPPVNFTINVQSGPVIVTHPTNQSVSVGGTTSFTVAASSTTGSLTYQWERSINAGASWFFVSDGGGFTGATNSTLTISGATQIMNGDQFRVRVTNSVGTSTSNAAALTVSNPPAFTSLATTTFVANQANIFNVVATGTPAPTYTVTGGNFPGWASLNQTTGVITGMPLTADIAGSPYIFNIAASNVNGLAGGTANQTFTLNVSATPVAPVISTQPVNQTAGIGQTVTFSVVASGSPTPTYQWQRFRTGDPGFVSLTDGGNYSGTATATLTVTNVTAAMNGDLYRVTLVNINGSATSSQAQLTLTVGTVFTTVAGQAGASGFADDTGPAARFASPNAVALDSSGNAYVADSGNHVIRKVTPAGVVTTLAGTAGSSGNSNGVGAAARFNTPSAVAVDSAGNVYVADSGNHIIRSIAPTGLVSTVAGSAGIFGTADGLVGDARFFLPSGIAVDAVGAIYVADTFNNTVRKIFGGSVTTVVTTAAGLSFPNGLAVDSGFNVYIADVRNHVIRKMAPGGGLSVLAGAIGAVGSVDGNGGAARFNQPAAVALDTAGNVYVADAGNHTIRRIATNGDVTTVGGLAGVSGNADGGGGAARFNQPYGIASDGSGNLWIADASNHTIRRSGALTAPQITLNPAGKIAFLGESATFTVGASGSPTPGFQWQRRAVGTDTFVNLLDGANYSGVNSATLTVLGITIEMNGDEFRAFANNLVEPIATSSGATLTVLPSQAPPTIVVHPVGTTVNVGDSPTFSVTATGSGTLSYQWRKDGSAIGGATSSTYTLPSARGSDAGLYTVLVSNAFGGVISSPAPLQVNTAPAFTLQPHSETALLGSPVSFSAAVSGASGATYQWRKNGVAIPGANGSIYTIGAVATTDAGNYDVIVTNNLGVAFSSLVQLVVTATPAAPSFTSHPASRTVVAGGLVTLTASATAAPAATYQWRKNGVPIGGANASTYIIGSAQAGDAGGYDVVATNTVGSATSLPALLQVIARSYAGVYFGSFGDGLGNFAIYIRPDNTGVFLGYLPGSTAPVMSLNIAVNGSGQFSFSQAAIASGSSVAEGEPGRAAALASVSVNGAIDGNGSVSGSVNGAVTTSLSAARSSDTGATQGVAGFYPAGAAANGGVAYTIANAGGQAFVVIQSGNAFDGGLGALTSNGQVSVATGRSVITETITPSSGGIVVASVGAVNASLSGASEATLATQRLANISSRARVGSGNSVAIAGFVITGSESKPVLIRAVGPSLASVGVTGTLPNPKLELYSGQTVIASATGIPAGNAATIAAASAQAGAFPLTPGAADSAILTTLSPGAYTAVVGSATTNTGVALVEVYDLSAPAAGQKLLNISTRADAGAGENTLIAGVVVTGAFPKRVLIRGIGPGLGQVGITTGTLPGPTLTLVRNGQPAVTVASNTNWNTSLDSAAITAAGVSVGAFPMVNGDSAMIVTLTPGNYTAQVNGAGGASGIALIEVYELP